MLVKDIWKKINKNTFVVNSDKFEEAKALILSKTSRHMILEKLVEDVINEDLCTLNRKNITQYKQASVMDLINIYIFSRGFGWVSSWIIKDYPLFNGQEISTRSISIPRINKSICRDAPKTTKYFHNQYLEIYNELSKDINDVYDSSHTYDKVRWCLPGTIHTSLCISGTLRNLNRHIEKFSQLVFMTEIAKEYKNAIKHVCPNAFSIIKERNRPVETRWKLEIEDYIEKKEDIEIICLQKFSSLDIEFYINNLPKRSTFQYLDPILNSLGIFKVDIITSILSARSFHRHRTLMPWYLKLLIKNKKPFIYKKENLLGTLRYEKKVNKLLEEGYKYVNENIDSIYHLPLGTAVKITSYATLPNILYMLELRGYASGGNKEYSIIANKGINILRNILGKKFCDHFSIIEKE